MKEDNF
ncbi:hypothetical protein D050_4886A, partial [Vibrio parahaemolyticus VPCR-2009]